MHTQPNDLWRSTRNPKHLEAQREARENMIRLFDQSRQYASSDHETMLIQSALNSVNTCLDERLRVESSPPIRIKHNGKLSSLLMPRDENAGSSRYSA